MYLVYRILLGGAVAELRQDASSSKTDSIVLTGTVWDTAGQPVANATITQGWSPFADDHSYYLTTTDDAGHFSLSGIPTGTTLLLAATAPGFSPQLRDGIVSLRPTSPLLSNPAIPSGSTS